MSGRVTAKFGSDLDHENIRSMDYLLDMLYLTVFTSIVIMLDNPAMT
jgi:hypothetical protein